MRSIGSLTLSGRFFPVSCLETEEEESPSSWSHPMEWILGSLSFQQERGGVSGKRGCGSGLGATDLSVLQRRSWLFRVIVSSFWPAPTSISRTCDGLFFLLLLFTSFVCFLGCGSKLFFVGYLLPSEATWSHQRIRGFGKVIANQKPNVYYSELFMLFLEQIVTGTTK